MERTANCFTFVSLVALAILVFCPVTPVRSLTEARPECCVRKETELKRYDDAIDYDTFVSLMGKRNAAQLTSHRNNPMSRKRNMDHVLTDLLLRRTRMDCVCTQDYLQRRD